MMIRDKNPEGIHHERNQNFSLDQEEKTMKMIRDKNPGGIHHRHRSNQNFSLDHEENP